MPLDLGAPADTMIRLAAAVRDEQLGDPTPCGDTNVSGLLAHIVGFSTAFRDGAVKVDGPTTSTPPGPMALPPDWRTQLPQRFSELAAAWRDPAAWEGVATVGAVALPASAHGGFANDELVIHGWDLAVATGQPYDVAPDNLEACWQLVQSIPDDPAARAGLFGPRLPIADDAPLLDRTLAYAGRNPGWGASEAPTVPERR
jgi:uncharacterized protein (TIGR03086 family)